MSREHTFIWNNQLTDPRLHEDRLIIVATLHLAVAQEDLRLLVVRAQEVAHHHTVVVALLEEQAQEVAHDVAHLGVVVDHHVATEADLLHAHLLHEVHLVVVEAEVVVEDAKCPSSTLLSSSTLTQ